MNIPNSLPVTTKQIQGDSMSIVDTLTHLQNLKQTYTRWYSRKADANKRQKRMTEHTGDGNPVPTLPQWPSENTAARAHHDCQNVRIVTWRSLANQCAPLTRYILRTACVPPLLNCTLFCRCDRWTCWFTDRFWQLEGIILLVDAMLTDYDQFKDETCLFGVHSSCLVVELCFRRVHIGKRRCCRLPRESNVSTHLEIRSNSINTIYTFENPPSPFVHDVWRHLRNLSNKLHAVQLFHISNIFETWLNPEVDVEVAKIVHWK